jgi:phosphate transport system protein
MERLLRHFEDERDTLTRRLLMMGGLVEEQLRQAVAGVVGRQSSLLDAVVQRDGPVNDLQREIDAHSLTILALHQPVAVDLRMVVGVIKVNGDLERVGDLAINIAQQGQLVVRHAPLVQTSLIAQMGNHAATMLQNALDACVRLDTSRAAAVLAADDGLDRLNRQVAEELVGVMARGPDAIEPALALLLIGRQLERVGDHATNIAETVVFMVSARDVRHQPPSSSS